MEDINFIMKTFLSDIRAKTNSDAGTVYLFTEDRSSLEFTAVQNDTLFLDLSKSEGNIPWPDLALYDENGKQNDINASVVCVLENKVFNVSNVSKYEHFEFEGPKAFDMYTGYDTVSMLVVPLRIGTQVIGALQLINKKDDNGHVAAFTAEDEKAAEEMFRSLKVSL